MPASMQWVSCNLARATVVGARPGCGYVTEGAVQTACVPAPQSMTPPTVLGLCHAPKLRQYTLAPSADWKPVIAKPYEQHVCAGAARREETLTQLLLGSLRKGGATEATLAARGLCLLAVTLGAGAEAAQLLRTCLGPLVDTARHVSFTVAVDPARGEPCWRHHSPLKRADSNLWCWQVAQVHSAKFLQAHRFPKSVAVC